MSSLVQTVFTGICSAITNAEPDASRSKEEVEEVNIDSVPIYQESPEPQTVPTGQATSDDLKQISTTDDVEIASSV